MIFSREISNFLLLFGLVALVQVHDANGEIDIDEIDRQLSNPCVPNARRRRDAREFIREINSISKDVFLEFKAENPGYCRFADKYTDLADIGVKEELPVRTSSSQLCDDLRFYYGWMLWIKEAKQFMDMVEVPSFNVTSFDNMVNYLRQAVCECPPSTSTPLFPDSTSSTDPVDYLEPTCYVLEKFSQFSTSAYACTRKGRKGDSKQKTTTDQPDKPASVGSPPTGTTGGESVNRKDGNKQKGGKSVNRKDGNKQKGQNRKENRRTKNRQVDQNNPESTRTDNSKRLPEESNPRNDIRRGGGQKRKGHDRKGHGHKKIGRKKNKPARIPNLDVENPIETISANTSPCGTKPETTKPERRPSKKGKGKKRKGKRGKRRGKKSRGGKRGKRNRKNRRRNKQRKNKNKKKYRRNKGKKDSKKVGRSPFPERKRKETKPILDFFFF